MEEQIEVYDGSEERCICGRLLSEDYWKDEEDNCYVHMTQGY